MTTKTIIPIDGGKYRIAADSWNHDLEKYLPERTHTDKDGKEKTIKESWAILGHYPNALQCLNEVARLEALGRDYNNIGEYIERLESLKEMAELIQALKAEEINHREAQRDADNLTEAYEIAEKEIAELKRQLSNEKKGFWDGL